MSTLQRHVLLCCSWRGLHSTPQGPELHLHLDVSTLQRHVLHWEVSTPQGPELHLDVSTLQRLVLLLELSTSQGTVLLLEMSTPKGHGVASVRVYAIQRHVLLQEVFHHRGMSCIWTFLHHRGLCSLTPPVSTVHCLQYNSDFTAYQWHSAHQRETHWYWVP